MEAAAHSYLNKGIYSLREAAALTGVSASRIRRWLKGYRVTRRQRKYGALWKGQWEPKDGNVALGFLDLVEVKFVEAFLARGVSWDMIHKARRKAALMFPGETHPFCTQGFMTDGKQVFVHVHDETGESRLMEIVQSQQVFAQMVEPLLKELEFGEEGALQRWWPRGKDFGVALDPRKNFGQPTIGSVPTNTLARSARANGSIAATAQWYEVPREAVAKAVEFEQHLVP